MRATDARPAPDRRRPGATRETAAPARAARARARSSRAYVVVCIVGGLALAASCGPSPRRVHYGDAFFERCAAADASGERAAEERRACWAEWLAHYRVGQPPERIAWATDRMAALAAGDGAPTVPELRAGAARSRDEADTSAEADADLLADTAPGTDPGRATGPDPELDASSAAPTTRGTAPDTRDDPSPPEWDRSPPAPAAERVGVCSAGCTPPWERCTARCDADAADCRRACDAEYQVCVRGCP